MALVDQILVRLRIEMVVTRTRTVFLGSEEAMMILPTRIRGDGMVRSPVGKEGDLGIEMEQVPDALILIQ